MTRRAPRVSVILPTWNAERFVGDAIDSIYRSAECADLDGIEIIFVDGGSTDATLEVAIARGPVRSVKQPGKGLADARNCGIHQAHGAIIAFLDADDRWTEDALRVRLDALAADGSRRVVTGKVRFVDSDGAARDRTHSHTGMVSGQTLGAVLLERSVS
jgi:Glycosyltransferases involved in cell wall biogenesis